MPAKKYGQMSNKRKPARRGPKGGAKTTRHKGKTTQRAASQARKKEFMKKRKESTKYVPMKKKATKKR